jgi:RimJ/RimL family protein N-acetyltransferase
MWDDHMAKSPDIRTKRLLITPFSKRHLTEHYVNWLNDPELMRFSEQRHKTHTLESCYTHWKSFEESPNYFWAIEEIESGFGHIGNMNVYVDKNNLLADVGVLIGEKQTQNSKYGTEAWIGVCNFLFQKAGIRKITAGTFSVNFPMLKLMRYVGMINDGVRKRHYICSGEEMDIIYMALFQEQWDSIIISGKTEGFLRNAETV